jgi:hypothetical protein
MGALVTDFSDWDPRSSTWGANGNFIGGIFDYPDPTVSASVDVRQPSLRLRGSIQPGHYGGGGLLFEVCASVAAFSRIEFTYYGGGQGCDVGLALQTFDQRPTDQVPPGGCNRAAGSCFSFPSLSNVANVDPPVASAKPVTVVKSLASFNRWSASGARQLIGLQWQFTRKNSASECLLDFAVTSVRFLP